MRVVNICAIVATLLLGLIAYDVHQFTRPARPMTTAEEIAAIKAQHQREIEILRATGDDYGDIFAAAAGFEPKRTTRKK